jgi:AcrR family transcriptional regulator
VAASSTREIAQQAGTTERTLFKHFGSKEGLVQAVLEEAVLAQLAPTSLAALSQAIDGFGGDLQAWHRALLTSRLHALSAAPELSRLLLAELLRDDSVRQQFAAQWKSAAWEPLLQLFAHLQRQGRLRRDLSADQLARQFLSLNLGFLIGRLLLAPDYAWDDQAEIAALARAFAQAALPSG